MKQHHNRREFLQTASLSALALSSTHQSVFAAVETPAMIAGRISQLKKPLAIAMWDYSWILRQHPGGGFEDWDKALSELAKRGYNAIRIDTMPQFVAADSDGKLVEEFTAVRTSTIPALWGNEITMRFRPREALLEFLSKCKMHGIRVGLASWFMRHGTGRTAIFQEEGGLLRAWSETLAFLNSHDLLDDNILYVDVLNEYPNWHGYDWFKNEMNQRADVKQFLLDNPDANVPPEAEVGKSRYTVLQRQFYNDFINTTLATLKDSYPALDFFASLDSGMNLNHIDLTHFGALDYHIWFAHKGGIPGLGEIRSRKPDLDYAQLYQKLTRYWEAKKDPLVNWIDRRIAAIAKAAAKHDLVCGNTEGWGPIFWFEPPGLDWRWVKESADICVDLALKHDNYKFICTSNFTHPQFKGMWDDVQWHQQITKRIKG